MSADFVAVRRGCRELSACDPVYDVLRGNAHRFYGDELGVQGMQEEEYRAPMPWKGGDLALLGFSERPLPCGTPYPHCGKAHFRCCPLRGQPRDPLPQVYRNVVRDGIHQRRKNRCRSFFLRRNAVLGRGTARWHPVPRWICRSFSIKFSPTLSGRGKLCYTGK